MRIVLLGINYAPEQTGIAPYTTALASHLARSHEVTVVAGMPHYPQWQVPNNFRRWRTDSVEGGVRVIRLRHYVPSKQTVGRRLAYELTWAARAAAAGSRLKADAVIAIVPALFAVPAAQLIARRSNAAFGMVVQDIIGSAASQSGVRVGRRLMDLIVRVEHLGLEAADSIATIHPRLATELQILGNRCERPSVIYNWTHSSHRPQSGAGLRREFGWSDSDVIALHSGNMGLKQNLEVVVDAARLAEREGSPIKFVLAGDGSQRARLERCASGCANISFVESQPADRYMDLLGSADVLLVNERPGVQQMSLPSKLTSYLVAGRPIIAAVDSDGATAEFIRASGGGIVTSAGDPEALLDNVAKLASDGALAECLVESGMQFAHTNLGEARALAAYDTWLADLTGIVS